MCKQNSKSQSLRFFITIFCLVKLNVIASCVGTIYPSEKTSWIDEETGFKITKYTNDNSRNWHLYFNIESFIDENSAVIFSDRTGKLNLFKLNLQSGVFIQMTDADNLLTKIWHLQAHKKLWYLDGNVMYQLNTETFESTKIFTLEHKLYSFAVTFDSKWIVYSAEKKSIDSTNNSIGPYALFKYSLVTGEHTQFSPDYGFIIGHVQTNPKDYSFITYCWQHKLNPKNGVDGWIPQRIWWINIDGTEGGPLAIQNVGLHRTHEFHFYDGSKIGYSARYIYGNRKDDQYIGYVNIDGSENVMIPAPVRFAHCQMFKDNKHWITDYYNGMNLVLLTVEKNRIIETKLLFRHNSSWDGQSSHPHPRFSPEGKYILFSTDKSGTPSIYSVKIDL